MVTFLDGSTIEIEPATTITVVQAAAAPSGAITIQLEQAIGRTWSSVQKLTHVDSRFEIRTPATTATVRGTGFVTDVLDSGTTTVTTAEGFVRGQRKGPDRCRAGGARSTVNQARRLPHRCRARSFRTCSALDCNSPAYLVVVEPFGRACGIVPAGPTSSGRSREPREPSWHRPAAHRLPDA